MMGMMDWLRNQPPTRLLPPLPLPVAPAPQRTVATPRTKTVGLSRYNRDYWYTHGCGLHMPQLGAPRNVQPLELCGSGSGVLEMSIKKCDTKASGIAFLVGVEV
ncbi:hypothetical protein AB1N83_011420 [Pleurotus pulmonarius]